LAGRSARGKLGVSEEVVAKSCLSGSGFEDPFERRRSREPVELCVTF